MATRYVDIPPHGQRVAVPGDAGNTYTASIAPMDDGTPGDPVRISETESPLAADVANPKGAHIVVPPGLVGAHRVDVEFTAGGAVYAWCNSDRGSRLAVG